MNFRYHLAIKRQLNKWYIDWLYLFTKANIKPCNEFFKSGWKTEPFVFIVIQQRHKGTWELDLMLSRRTCWRLRLECRTSSLSRRTKWNILEQTHFYALFLHFWVKPVIPVLKCFLSFSLHLIELTGRQSRKPMMAGRKFLNYFTIQLYFLTRRKLSVLVALLSWWLV